MDENHTRRYIEASDWLLRLSAPNADEVEIAEWLLWCEADPANLAAYERMRQDLHDLEPLKTDGAASQAPRARDAAHTRRQRMMVAGLSLAGGVALAVGVVAWPIRVQSPRQEIAAPAANQAATLPDGSSLELSAKALVAMDFTGTRRQLALKVGEAYFKVRHDPRRPFVVQAGEVTITDIGTAFDVRRDDDRITVTVEEGEVHVSAGQGVGWSAGAGYQLVYVVRTGTATLASVDPLKVLKWRDGELAYVSIPFETVIADVNRYSGRRIVIRDPAVARMHFTGTVFTASIDDWLKTVVETYPLRTEEIANGDVVLVPVTRAAAAQ